MEGGSTYYNATDHLGSASLAVDAAGAVAQKLDYLPFGGERVNARTGSFDAKHTFTDQEKDEENGLMYYGARYYNPRIGRFTSADPVIIDTIRNEFAVGMANPQLLNPYAYAGNNPLKYTDENGEFIFLPVIAAVYAAPYAAGLIATGFVGLTYATKYYAEALGHYSEGADSQANQAIANEMVAVQTTAAAGMTIMALDKAVSGSGQKNTQQSNNTNTAQQIQGTKTSLPDDALVVRGGAGTTPEAFQMGTHKASGLKGFSVESKAGADLCKLCTNLPQNQVRTTTVKDVRAAGGNVVPTKGNSPNHATVTNLNPQTANKVFSQPIKNPVPKASRVIRR